jgi:hypothetical protein
MSNFYSTDELALRVADCVVLASDGSVKEQAADFWEINRSYHDAVVREVADLVAAAGSLQGCCGALLGNPTSVPEYRALVEAATTSLPALDSCARPRRVVEVADEHILIDHYVPVAPAVHARVHRDGTAMPACSRLVVSLDFPERETPRLPYRGSVILGPVPEQPGRRVNDDLCADAEAPITGSPHGR